MFGAIQRLRERHNREGGFTLIELMVVVMIIGILLAIAIPAFLGAQSRAREKAVKANLRNALAAAQTRFSDLQVFEATGTLVTGLTADEPSLTWVDGTASTGLSDTDKEISVHVAADQVTVYMAAWSTGKKTCYILKHVNATPGGTTIATDTTAANCWGGYGPTATGYTAF